MPLYEYTCRSCEHRFEVLQPIGAGADGLTCPRCGEREVVKQFSTFAASSSSSGGQRTVAGGGCGAPACGTGFT